MWPWSTIAKLRADLAEAQADADRFSKISGRLSTENELLRQRWTALNESYEQVCAMRDATVRERDELLRVHARVVMERNALASQLAEAVKNDYRDPVTKRFAKRPEARS